MNKIYFNRYYEDHAHASKFLKRQILSILTALLLCILAGYLIFKFDLAFVFIILDVVLFTSLVITLMLKLDTYFNMESMYRLLTHKGFEKVYKDSISRQVMIDDEVDLINFNKIKYNIVDKHDMKILHVNKYDNIHLGNDHNASLLYEMLSFRDDNLNETVNLSEEDMTSNEHYLTIDINSNIQHKDDIMLKNSEEIQWIKIQINEKSKITRDEFDEYIHDLFKAKKLYQLNKHMSQPNDTKVVNTLQYKENLQRDLKELQSEIKKGMK